MWVLLVWVDMLLAVPRSSKSHYEQNDESGCVRGRATVSVSLYLVFPLSRLIDRRLLDSLPNNQWSSSIKMGSDWKWWSLGELSGGKVTTHQLTVWISCACACFSMWFPPTNVCPIQTPFSNMSKLCKGPLWYWAEISESVIADKHSIGHGSLYLPFTLSTKAWVSGPSNPISPWQIVMDLIALRSALMICWLPLKLVIFPFSAFGSCCVDLSTFSIYGWTFLGIMKIYIFRSGTGQ